MLGVSVVDEAGGLLAVHLLLKMAMEKCIRDVHLMHRPGAGDGKLEDGPYRPGFHNWSKSVGEVDARSLKKTAHHPTRFVAVECAVGAKLALEDPFAGDDVGVAGTRDELPCPITL